jgi:GTPase SAR1 family protein
MNFKPSIDPAKGKIFKCCIVGAQGVGKTSLIKCLSDYPESQSNVIEYTSEESGSKITLRVIDTTQEDVERGLSKSYFMGFRVILFVSDVAKLETIEFA